MGVEEGGLAISVPLIRTQLLELQPATQDLGGKYECPGGIENVYGSVCHSGAVMGDLLFFSVGLFLSLWHSHQADPSQGGSAPLSFTVAF